MLHTLAKLTLEFRMRRLKAPLKVQGGLHSD